MPQKEVWCYCLAGGEAKQLWGKFTVRHLNCVNKCTLHSNLARNLLLLPLSTRVIGLQSAQILILHKGAWPIQLWNLCVPDIALPHPGPKLCVALCGNLKSSLTHHWHRFATAPHHYSLLHSQIGTSLSSGGWAKWFKLLETGLLFYTRVNETVTLLFSQVEI